jgi:hypothetical protein
MRPYHPMRSVLMRSMRPAGSYYRKHVVSPADLANASWSKSSFSAANGDCVDVARLHPDLIGVRDTKDKGRGPVLVFTQAEWTAFIAGAKHGEFDSP